MNFTTGLAIYFIIWWLILFAVLPFGIRAQESHEIVPGTDPGAPAAPGILKKALWTSVAAAVIFAAFLWVRSSGYSIKDVPFLGTLHR